MNAEMLKGHLDAIVLAALADGPAHGYAIIEQIRRLTDGAFDLPEGTIYPALHRLEEAGLLESDWQVVSGARRRRVYALTKVGTASLSERKQSWRRFATAVDSLLEGRKPWPA